MRVQIFVWMCVSFFQLSIGKITFQTLNPEHKLAGLFFKIGSDKKKRQNTNIFS